MGGTGGTCKASSCTKELSAGQVSGYQTVGSFFGETEQDLMSAVQQNPVSVAIEADQSSFQLYKSVFSQAHAARSSIMASSPWVTERPAAPIIGRSKILGGHPGARQAMVCFCVAKAARASAASWETLLTLRSALDP